MTSKPYEHNIYIAGPMRGYAEFNFPAFRKAAEYLRAHGWNVFSPAEKDIEHHDGVDISKGNLEGDEALAAKEHGFDLRRALDDDTTWICRHADAIYMLRGWQDSKGAVAEKALADALGLKVYYE
jgi:hypothetical protein